MIHTLAAYKYRPEASTAFSVGNLAPDSINIRELKDRLHLRTEGDRMSALKEMMQNVNLDDDFQRGVAFHLYLDLLWDRGPLKQFIESYQGSHWFIDYREAIGTASAWVYHQNDWSDHKWSTMSKYRYDGVHVGESYSVSAINDFVKRNYKWHRETKVVSSGHFSEEVIEDITSYAAESFDQLLEA